MKILMVSNLYPPFKIGGYEMRCSWVAEELQKRGHEVHVICSSYGRGKPVSRAEIVNGATVHRILHDYSYTHVATTGFQKLVRAKQQYSDTLKFARLLDSVQPDIVNWWNLGGLCKGILSAPSSRGIPDIHWVEDVWMKQLRTNALGDSLGWDAFWQGKLVPKFLKWLLKPAIALLKARVKRKGIATTLDNLVSDYACFSCEFQRKANMSTRLKIRNSSVIFGVSRGESFNQERDWEGISLGENPLHLLYISAITESRQVHVLIDALEMMDEEQKKRFSLTIVGGPPLKKWEPYYNSIRKRVMEGPLKDTVRLLGQMPYEELPGICASHDVLVFTSGRPEGTPNIVIEAMLSGLCVLSTGAGGSGEIADAAGQPIFPVGDSRRLKDILLQLEKDRNCLASYAKRSQETALRDFSFGSMIDKFEDVLIDLRGKEYGIHSIPAGMPLRVTEAS